MSYILKEIFGDTKRVRILEELLEQGGGFLSVSEISRMSEVSKKTVYVHLYQLEELGIIISQPGRTTKYGLNMDDKRAVALSIIEDQEYLRKIEISIKETEEQEITEKVSKDIETSINTIPLFEKCSITENHAFSGAYNIKA